MSDEAAILFANDAFYAAFARHDVAAMNEVWSRREAVTCIHPGWQAVSGREAVMQTWAAILGGPHAPAISCRLAVARRLGEVAYVLCYEVVEGSVLVATNVFVRENGAWRMVHHQAGVSSLPRSAEAAEPAPTLQ